MSSNARKSSASKIKLDTFADLFGNDTTRGSSLEQIISVPLADLHTFKDHPFGVVDDEKMEETTESIKKYGVLVPGIARPGAGGGYEIIAGHRRKRGSERAGKSEMPVKSVPEKAKAKLKGGDTKKFLLQNFPYLLFAYVFNKMAWLYTCLPSPGSWR